MKSLTKMIVLQFLFDSQHLEKYITQRIKQFSSHVRIIANITQALDLLETEQIIEERLTYLYSQPESYLLEQLSLKKDVIKPMIKPSIVSLCAESALYVLDMVAESGQVIIIYVYLYNVSDNLISGSFTHKHTPHPPTHTTTTSVIILIMLTVVPYVCKYSTGIYTSIVPPTIYYIIIQRKKKDRVSVCNIVKIPHDDCDIMLLT